uniref:Uncharacterized protein n=1 Tax=Rangifer tarandus platyrhynchus TaxID=3082113 RepID=A0ACB0ES33_RANTA|nr:unnamed protein product [Rangifer tarandus platyrhynchus]
MTCGNDMIMTRGNDKSTDGGQQNLVHILALVLTTRPHGCLKPVAGVGVEKESVTPRGQGRGPGAEPELHSSTPNLTPQPRHILPPKVALHKLSPTLTYPVPSLQLPLTHIFHCWAGQSRLQPDTGRWTFSHFTEATTEAQKSAAELGDGIRPSDGGVRPESGGAAGTGAQGREWASASSPPPQGAEPGSLQRAGQVRGQWARHSGRARVGAGEGPKQAEPHAHPPSHPPFLPWLVAGEWVSRNRQAAEKTGRRRNQITHLQL